MKHIWTIAIITAVTNTIFSYQFPSDFLWGVATAEYQLSGSAHCPNSNWAAWEKAGKVPPSKNACDHWSRSIEDIQLIKNIAANTYRFSVEWSNIEPTEGEFNQDAINHYIQLCKELCANNIKPIVTLHHFTHPTWFEQRGAFENEKNIIYFVRFCTRMFNELKPYVHLWCTINEPAGFVAQGYLRGLFPPGKKNPPLAIKVLQHLMQAHVAVYQAIKQLPDGANARIGLVKSVFQFKPYHQWHPIERIASSVANKFYNGSIMQFFTTGRFKFSVPFVARTDYYDPAAPHTLDFIGLNYYSHLPLACNLFSHEIIKERFHPDEIMTDMPTSICPQGLYDAIEYIAQLGVPIYITENGIADAKDDRRELFCKEYLNQLIRALQNGYDVRSYLYWSLMDNYEWAEGKSMRFGLYHVDYATQKRTLRPGAQYLTNIMHSCNNQPSNRY